jgi:hypothetical protein
MDWTETFDRSVQSPDLGPYSSHRQLTDDRRNRQMLLLPIAPHQGKWSKTQVARPPYHLVKVMLMSSLSRDVDSGNDRGERNPAAMEGNAWSVELAADL